jgi:hypothetical protein
MHQLQSQAGFDAFRGLPGPAAQEVPGPQPKVFGHQQPQTEVRTADLVGQELAHAAFQTAGIGRLGTGKGPAALGGQRWFNRRLAAMEFFFEGRSGQ